MNLNDMYPSKYLKAEDIDGEDAVVTVHSVQMEDMGQGEDTESRPVVYFEELDKGLVLNRTNANTVSGLHGPETDSWTGKKITLYATEVDYKGKVTLGIRVRLRAPGAKGATAAPTSGPRNGNGNGKAAPLAPPQRASARTEAIEAAGFKPPLRAVAPAAPAATEDGPISEVERRQLLAASREVGLSVEAVKVLLQDGFGIGSSKDIPRSQFQTVLAAVRSYQPAAEAEELEALPF